MTDPVQAAYADAAAIAADFCYKRSTEGGMKSPAVFTTHTHQFIREAILARAAEVAAAPAMGEPFPPAVRDLQDILRELSDWQDRSNSAEAALTAATERAERAEARAERLRAALIKLEKAATEVARYGAQTGPQWSKLTSANLLARAAIAADKQEADHE